MDTASLSRFRGKSLGGTVCKWTGIALLLGSLTVIGILEASAQEPRHYTCYRTIGPITVDGKLDEPDWETAPWTDLFVNQRQSDSEIIPRFCTRAMMLWDSTYFYVAADLEEPDVWGTLTERDAIIYLDNDFEVFIDPNGDELEYYELEINALNTVMDLFMDKPYDDGGDYDMSWDVVGVKTAVHINGTLNDPGDVDQGWSVEIAFPWEVLAEYAHKPAPPNHGDEWRVNLLRVDYYMDVVDGEYQKRPGAPRSDWVWTPHRTWIHDPEDWGYVYFSTEAEDRPPKVLSVTTTPDILAAGQSTPVELTVLLAGGLEIFPQMRLDLSPIGLSSTFPLEHEGAGQYTASTTVPPLRNDRYYLPVMVETAEGGDWYCLFEATLDVYPEGDMIIYEEGLGDGWAVETAKATSDLQATDYFHSGSTSQAITLERWGNIKYPFEDPEGLSTFGYAHLEFYFHPGAASIPDITVVVRPTMGGTGVKLSSLGIDFERREWQQVQIPFIADVISSIYLYSLASDIEGTFYIDDMRLVAKEVEMPTAVEEITGETAVPLGYALSQNYPNPFNPQTTIRYDLPEPGTVRLSVYNVLGQMVRTLVDGQRCSGTYSVIWDGRDGTGRVVASAVYLYRLEVEGQYVQTRRMVLLR